MESKQSKFVCTAYQEKYLIREDCKRHTAKEVIRRFKTNKFRPKR